MLNLKPAKSLLFLTIGSTILGILAIFLTGLPFLIKTLLCLLLIIFAIYESLKLMHKTPRSLMQFKSTSGSTAPWVLILKNGKTIEAKLLPSTRITHKMIILHFRGLHEKIQLSQIVLPNTIGPEAFHDLLVKLKTN